MKEGLDRVINERVSFLKEQINPNNKPLVNRAFEIQIETIRNADHEKVALLILQKKKQLEAAKEMAAIEELYTELEALEWLQRQVVKHYA
jgi:ribosomal protein L20A (L18A)